MPRKIEHDGGYDKARLQASLRRVEAAKGKLLTIEAKNGNTYTTHDWKTGVPVNSLVLELDPDGKATGPAGSTPIASGTAVISGKEEKVTCFRIAAEAEEAEEEAEAEDPA